jgi:hypothetical protein
VKWFATALARFYGPALCKADSATRIAALQAALAAKDAMMAGFLLNALKAELADETYATASRTNQPDYRSHLASNYWCRLTARVREAAGGYCASCSVQTAALECHHPSQSYRLLGRETVQDLIPLCRTCHQGIHNLTPNRKRRTA